MPYYIRMSPNLSYYKSNPLHNATRKRRRNENENNNTMHPTLKRNNRGRRNLLKKVRLGVTNEKNYITPRSNNEVNRRNKKYHGNTYRQGLDNKNYMNEYRQRRAKMTPSERKAENEEEKKVNAELERQAPTAKSISNYRKKILRNLKDKNNNNN